MPTFHTRMPTRRPHIGHTAPSWRGDRPAAIRAAARKRVGADGVRAIDCNFQVIWNDRHAHDQAHGCTIYNLHWRTAAQNNYRWIVDGRRVRRMTRAELHRPIDQWTSSQVARWRRSRSKGSERPRTYAWMVRYAQRRGVTICAELKHSAFAYAWVMRQAVAAARSANHPAWFMALLHLPYADRKAAATRAAGGYFALIFGTYGADRRRWPAVRRAWRVQPSSVW